MPDQPSAFHQHDHQQCIHHALESAKALCQQRGARLTAVRERVLELIWQSHRPLGAYQLLEQLAKEGFNSAPPTVYRSLDFLQEQGLVHRIASLNAFIGCDCPEENHSGCFLICRECSAAQELDSNQISDFLNQRAADKGFKIEQQTVELSGLCPRCLSNSEQQTNASNQTD